MFIFSTEDIHYIRQEKAPPKWGILLYRGKALIQPAQKPQFSGKNPRKKTAQRCRRVSRFPVWAV